MTAMLINALYDSPFDNCSVLKHKRQLCSKTIIDIKIYQTNIQTLCPYWGGGVGGCSGFNVCSLLGGGNKKTQVVGPKGAQGRFDSLRKVPLFRHHVLRKHFEHPLLM